MSAFRGTPGPWVAMRGTESTGREVADWAVTVDNHHTWICTGPTWDAEHQQESFANARLIAAAPELLGACQTFSEWLRREDQGWGGKRDTKEGEAAWREWWNENLRICALAQEQVRAAIAKATGSAP